MIRSHFQRLFLIIASAIILVGIGLYVFLHNKQPEQASAIPSSIISSVDFPLHFPKSLPQGLKLDNASFQTNREFISFAFTTTTGNVFHVSEQALPDGLDPQKLGLEKKTTNSIGDGYLTELNYRTTGVILTDRTMITVSALNRTSESEITSLLRSF